MNYMKEAITMRLMKVTPNRQQGYCHTVRYRAFMKSLFHAPLTCPWSIACIGADGKQGPSCSESHFHSCIGLRQGGAQVWWREMSRESGRLSARLTIGLGLLELDCAQFVSYLEKITFSLKSGEGRRWCKDKSLMMKRQRGFRGKALIVKENKWRTLGERGELFISWRQHGDGWALRALSFHLAQPSMPPSLPR